MKDYNNIISINLQIMEIIFMKQKYLLVNHPNLKIDYYISKINIMHETNVTNKHT